MDSFLLQAIIYLAAAILCVPLAKKLGLSSVLGYIFAGMLIGPYILGWIGQKGEDLMHFAEFGVVMMLFLVGLELEPAKFWKMRKFILGMGSIQLVLTATVLTILMITLIGWSVQTSIAIALALTMSSTAIVLQTLSEKNLNNTSAARSSFAVLLFQDIAVIPILALIPLLAVSGASLKAENSAVITEGLPNWLQTIIVIGSIGLITLAGKYIIEPLLRIIAKTRLQELFTASALLLVMGVSYLMEMVGLSPALGAFIAGVVLANSEFKHELEGDIEPFKGLLLGLFFIGVGASVNFPLIMKHPWFVLIFVLILTAVKFFILFLIGKIYKKSWDQNLLFAFALSQAGEFGFVIMSFSRQLEIINRETSDIVMAIIAISMLLTPFLLLFNERVLEPKIGTKFKTKRKEEVFSEEIQRPSEVVIAGFGHFGGTIGRMLKTNNITPTILDHDSERVDILRKMGYEVYYGDATRVEVLKAAKLEEAKLFIAAVDNPEVNLQLMDVVRKNFPHVKVMTRARNRNDAYQFIDLGIKDFYRDTLYSAVTLGVDALVSLGLRKYTATRQGYRFIKYDIETTKKLAAKRHDKKAYFSTLKKEIETQEELLKNDLFVLEAAADHSWERDYLKEENE
ncbi:potassium transporter [Ornithobacterium rhinotracheale]|uniref:monovalent cation:proton antiporter-2 (CPA2) family protein n=1 Tax=Ornithobacterium rhinotracheale TaxID=28251 RepID=UPI00129C2D4C|nr:monovalent cation:proton antiporter-2 (CPA2) family protein [Ornithobacterium rhinotracheale]MRI62872.1 potassium transporter [Ornithobacterium rhinotracheale]